MTDAVVISGAAPLIPDATPAPLVSVPDVLDVTVTDPGGDLELVLHNRTGAPLATAAGGGGEATIAPGSTAAVRLHPGPHVCDPHLQTVREHDVRSVTLVVGTESSGEDLIVVGQAIGAGPGRVLSCAKDLEPGVRAMLLLAPEQFRLDVLILGDALQTFVRPLTGGELDLHGEVGQPRVATTTLGLGGRYAPGRADLRFALGPAEARVLTEVTIATLRFPERGVIRVAAQATIRDGG